MIFYNEAPSIRHLGPCMGQDDFRGVAIDDIPPKLKLVS